MANNVVPEFKIRYYMHYNEGILDVILCKSFIPLTYIHTKYCYLIETRAKNFKLNCSRCNMKLRDVKIWHCQCEKQKKCKRKYNFCNSCYHHIIFKQKQKQNIISNWNNNDVKKWIFQTKWSYIPKQNIEEFKAYLTLNVFDKMDGNTLLSLKKSDIMNTVHSLPKQWRIGFKNMFILHQLETQYNNYDIINDRYQMDNVCHLSVLVIGYSRTIIHKRVSKDVICIILKYVRTLNLILQRHEIKILDKAMVYMFDDIIMKEHSKLIIGQNMKGLIVNNNILMQSHSKITSSIHYEQPNNINIKCEGTVLMEGGIIEIMVCTNNIVAGNIDIECNQLIMDKYSKISTVANRWRREIYDLGKIELKETRRYGNITIKLMQTEHIHLRSNLFVGHTSFIDGETYQELPCCGV